MRIQSSVDGSVGGVFVMQTWGLDFKLQHPHKCQPVILALLRWSLGDSQGEPAS